MLAAPVQKVRESRTPQDEVGESAFGRGLEEMLMGVNLNAPNGSPNGGVVNGTTWTGAMAVRANTTTRPFIANGSIGQFLNALNTTLNYSGNTSSARGSVLRKNGFPENYLVVSPQYSSANIAGNLNNSTYHSAQLQFTRRLTNGFTNTTTWTWSKALGDADGDAGANYRDPTRRDIEKTLLGFDRTHQITSNGTYELPFGTGHRLLASDNRHNRRKTERGWTDSGGHGQDFKTVQRRLLL